MSLSLRTLVYAALLLALALLPLAADLTGNRFYLTLANRAVILAIAAISLNLIMGHGGMISFGHAAYLGIGGYAVAILAEHGIDNGWLQFGLAIGAAALFAFLTGLVALRSRGVYFIMISLAFAQIAYFAAVGAWRYGGDDGLTIFSDSRFVPGLRLGDSVTFYYLCLVLLVVVLVFIDRIVRARFGFVLRGIAANETRLGALGFAVFRHRLAAFVIAGALCGLAGALLANFADFVSPSMMDWTRSGDLIVMVVLGGVGTLMGPVLGAVAFVVLEQELSGLLEHWRLVFGPLLVLVVLAGNRGLDGLLRGRRNDG